MAMPSNDEPGSLTSQLSRIFAKAADPPPPQEDHDPALDLAEQIRRATRFADSLSLFSENERLEDVSTSSLRALFLQSVWAEVSTRIRTKPADVAARKATLQSAKAHYSTFVKSLYDLEILAAPPSSSSSSSSSLPSLSSGSPVQLLAALLRPYGARNSPSTSFSASAPTMPTQPHQRRELKVALFKLERSMKSALDSYRHAVRQKARSQSGASGSVTAQKLGLSSGSSAAADDFQGPEEAQWDLLVLPHAKTSTQDEADDDDDDDDDEDSSDAFVSGSGKASASATASSPAAGGSVIDTPTSLRAYLVLLLRLHALLAYNNLAFVEDELSLLANIPASAQRDAEERQAREEAEAERRRRQREGGDDAYDLRLEQRFDASAPGPLMDDKGKPLRPFTITSGRSQGSGSAGIQGGLPVRELNERQRIRDGVFQPGHRLPTMSVDEYLEEEARRGNILTGGGAEGAAKATPREARASRAEMDGTAEAEEAREEERQEAIYWDEFREANKRGAGNTMNRG